MEIGSTFEIELDGVEENAKLIDILEYNEERFAVYAVNKDNNMSDLYTSKIIKHDDGSEELVSFDNEEVREYILKLVHETINR